jgi:hypothetical protein
MPSGRRRRRSRLAHLGIASALAAALLVLAAPAVPAAVTIGQLAPPNPASETSADTDRAQPSVISGNSYVVPATGGITAWTLTSWSHNAAADLGQELTMKVFRKVADPMTYTVVGHDGPRPLTPSIVNTFQTSLPVKAGDVLGNNSKSPAENASYFPAPGESFIVLQPGLGDGQTGPFLLSPDPLSLNISAVLEPSNTFALGSLTRNKAKGTATLEATVPNPGDLAVGGKGVKSAADSTAVTSKAVGGGPVQLTIRAKGKKKRKLNDTGKVKVKPKITYTPTGGAPSTQSIKVKLRKR